MSRKDQLRRLSTGIHRCLETDIPPRFPRVYPAPATYRWVAARDALNAAPGKGGPRCNMPFKGKKK
jgi:hypothetical protein